MQTNWIEDLKLLDIADIFELAARISSDDLAGATSVPLARLSSLMATRACRMSVMIGDPLNHTQMCKVRPHRYLCAPCLKLYSRS